MTPNLTSRSRNHAANPVAWLFGLVVLAIGAVNILWGNDAGFGVFIGLLALVYFPPVNAFIKNKTGRTIPVLAKVILGLFILWAALGVGELLPKIDLMRQSF